MPNCTILEPSGLQALLHALRARGYRVLGPQLRDGAIVLAEVTGAADLPHGVGDEQAPGHYRVRPRDDAAVFGFAATAQSPKAVLFPPDELLWRGRRTGTSSTVEPAAPATAPVALVGVRACDLAAIGMQDRVLLGRQHVDAHYAARRADVLLVAVTCATPGGTCFCASMGTGPRPGAGADLVLTELPDPHRFLVEAGSGAGEALLADLPVAVAVEADLAAAEAVVAGAVAAMGRVLDTADLPGLLRDNADSPRWAAVGERCLACANCTNVCPTCFCTSISDVSDLTGQLDERHRVWDSCFSLEYSYIHGGATRTATASRYRQWATHKLDAWHDQFASSGCVGCGRCITWCPAGIDLTAEVAAVRELAQAHEVVAAAVAGPALPVPTPPSQPSAVPGHTGPARHGPERPTTARGAGLVAP
ncbi:MAG TPA: 4Fe-4S dicluster domain-containing protein [Candidatus Nanopelagicales bacterium]